MSLENNIKRMVDALEVIAKCISNPQVEIPAQPAAVAPQPVAPVVQEVNPAPTSQPVAPPVQPVTPVAPVPITSGTSAPGQSAYFVPVVTTMTPEEMNAALVAEFKRLGGRDPIDQAMTQFGVTSVADLSGEMQQKLLATVRAIQP